LLAFERVEYLIIALGGRELADPLLNGRTKFFSKEEVVLSLLLGNARMVDIFQINILPSLK
jgi:hypothetical protein